MRYNHWPARRDAVPFSVDWLSRMHLVWRTLGHELAILRCEKAVMFFVFFFQAEDGIRDWSVTRVQTCALPISSFFIQSLLLDACRPMLYDCHSQYIFFSPSQFLHRNRPFRRRRGTSKNLTHTVYGLEQIGRASCRERV